MDILCVGMYRACSTWQYEVAAELVESHRGGIRLGYLSGDEYARLPESSHWRVLKSHEGHPAFRKALRHGKALAITSIRDPRDVVYSMLHKRSQTFRVFLREGMIHQIVANAREWSRQPAARCLTQRYERVVAAPEDAIAELAAFMGIAIDRMELERLAAEYSLEANRRRALATAERLRASGLDLNDPQHATRHDERSLLHWNHVRTGRMGEWRYRATPAERRVMRRILNHWIARNGYEPDGLEAVTRETVGERITREADQAVGWVRCTLRCAALNYPRTGRTAKRLLGISP
ncbi:MAG: hypothetical protein KatS3mg108_1238 [Isosphaeraceae bacterium]|jgi:hypothetical protein|nr:MAG: hypothetical protein KatS3mg108_1238 [Isosphaeraceae bacterium]